MKYENTASQVSVGLNSLIGDRSERIFYRHLQEMHIRSVLDIGSNSGQFSIKLRNQGYSGTIYSVEPQSSAYKELLENSRCDPRWIPLPRQAAGEHQHTIQINVSENSWSSSILDVHENHLRAAPATRSIRTEQVFVTRTGDILAAENLRHIQAIKIDVQGYEAKVLAGYLDFISNVKLLMLELSMIKCYEGAPDMFQLDDLLVNTYGFSRISFEPSFYDEEHGIAQQFDGLYYRPEASDLEIPPSREIYPVIATSTTSQLHRYRPDGVDIGHDWNDFCVRSWNNITDTVISVTENEPKIPNIRWHRVPTRPSIREILNEAVEVNKSHILLINADVGILESFKKLMGNLDPNVLYYGHRVEVTTNTSNYTELEAQSIHEYGFDYFLLPTSIAVSVIQDELIPVDFLIGEPWWDYLLPLVAQSKGFPIKRLPSVPFLCIHYKHEDRYNKETWIKNGTKFLRIAEQLFSNNESRNKAVLEEILLPIDDIEMNLNRISGIMRSSLP